MDINAVTHMLATIKGCTFASLEAHSMPVLKGGKKNPLQGRVIEISEGVRVILFTNKKSNGYENMVRRRLLKEGKDAESFELGKLPWGTRIPETPLIEHNGKYYIQTVLLSPGEKKYYVDHVETPREDIPGLPEDKSHKYQGLEQEHAVKVRTFSLENIHTLRMMGEVTEDIAAQIAAGRGIDMIEAIQIAEDKPKAV